MTIPAMCIAGALLPILLIPSAGLGKSAFTHYRIEGKLLEENVAPGAPIAGAWVGISSLRLGAYTDTLGRFVLSGRARPGCYRLHADYIGHHSAWHDFELGAESRVHLSAISLQSTAIPEDHPTRTGKCVPADSSVEGWAAAFGRAEVTVAIPDGVALDSLWIKADWGCRQGVPEEVAISKPKSDARYRFPLAISVQRLLPPYDDRVNGFVDCRVMAYTHKRLAGYTDVPIRVALQERDVVPTPVRIELRTVVQ